MVMWSVEDNRVVPVNLEFHYKGPHRARHVETEVYTSLYVSDSRGKKYLSARKKTPHCEYFTAPVGALVLAEYSFGSRRHSYFEYYSWFVVEEGSEVREEDEEYALTATNLKKLGKPTKEQLVLAEARILNAGLYPSSFVPIKSIVHFLGDSAFDESEVTAAEARVRDLAVEIAVKLLKKRPEVLEELGYDVESVREAFLAITPQQRPSRVRTFLRHWR